MPRLLLLAVQPIHVLLLGSVCGFVLFGLLIIVIVARLASR